MNLPEGIRESGARPAQPGASPAACPMAPGPGRKDQVPPLWETWLIRVILGLFVTVAFRAIHHNAMHGQDISTHMIHTRRMLDVPGLWFTNDITFRPLLYWIGGWCVQFTNGTYGYQLASMIFTLAGATALALVHDATRRVIGTPVLRVAGIALIAFLPMTVITTVVYAADTAVSLPFILAGWALMVCLEQAVERRAAGFAALAGLAFAIGNLTKATFLGLPAAVAIVMLLLWRSRRLSWRRAGVITVLTLAAPGLVGLWINQKAKRETAGGGTVHTFNWKGTGEMTFRSLLLVKDSDRRILDAPEYLTTAKRETGDYYPLLLENNYSYPALLHLGVFSDVLNFANNSVTPRPEPARSAAKLSVRLGLAFTLPALIAVLVLILRTSVALAVPRLMPSTPALIWSVLALAWYLPIFLTLPFVAHVYVMGYWLPRLVMPSIWIFLLMPFAWADLIPGRWPAWLGCVLLGMVTVLGWQEILSLRY